MKIKFKKKSLILFFLLTTITLSIINFKNTSKTNLYFLNFESEKLTLGNFITLSFFAGFSTTLIFLYFINPKNKNYRFDIKSDLLNDKTSENNNVSKEIKNERPPERDIRESQPTISVNYRIIKQNENKINDNNFREDQIQNEDDWEEIKSNW
tara:strand:+ start:168 stop:626 length:459 start_codon:yes stop_codon:yes gene_type:complete